MKRGSKNNHLKFSFNNCFYQIQQQQTFMIEHSDKHRM